MLDEQKSHPSYGLVQFSRINGRFDNLFGTNVESSNAIALRIKRCKTSRELGKTWTFDDGEIIEVYLSPNQFSELLTTMNHGSGVPCTIKAMNYKRIEEPPRDTPEPVKIQDDFEDKLSEISECMQKDYDRIQEILAKKTINKTDREEIKKQIEHLHMEVRSNLPFYLKQFRKSTEKIVRDAKSTVDAFVTGVIARAGIKSIKDNNGIVALPKLDEE